MSLRSWIAAHRSLVATATSGTVVAAIVAGFAITSTGYTAQKLDLGDGSVWVANGTLQAVGRANPEVLELNSVVRAAGADLEVVQQGTTVLVVDHANATVQLVDAATSALGEATALPPEDARVFLAGDRVVIHAAGTGELWVVPVTELPDFDAAQPTSLSLGLDSVVSVAPDGTLFAYSAELDQVFRVDAARSDAVSAQWTAGLADAEDVQVTSVGSAWAVVDQDGRRVALERGVVDLADFVDPGGEVVPQEPSIDGDRLLLGIDGGLLSVPLSGAAVVPLVEGEDGAPAAPLRVDGCEYGAWASGTAWRRCAGSGEGTTLPLEGPTSGILDFAVNVDRVVLNDVRRGSTWAVQDRAQLIDNWDDLLVDDQEEQVEQNDDNVPPTVEEEQQPPVAVDDAFGARPGRSTVLPVLLNDYDPNADVLVITSVDAPSNLAGRIDLVTRNQQLQLTLADDASGTLTFRYTITDGRGGTATATVTVTVRGDSENSPPVQMRTTRTEVAAGGRITTQVLGDWVDPDGDPFYLTSATTASPDQVTHKPDGVVVFSDSGQGGDLKSVTLVVTDGQAESTGSVAIGVSPVGQLPIVIEPWVALATSGQEITIRPMSHVRGGNGTLRLNAVPERAGATIKPSFEAGTFTFESDQVRTHYVEFTVTDGDQTATGLVRIDVAAPPDANTRPITVPRTVFITTLSSDTIDPTTTDIDPAGGVLVVTGVDNDADGIRAEVLDQRQVRITLTAPLEGRSVDVNYRISNGLADAVGTITVVEIPEPAQLQPPVTVDDTATVRVGDVVDIPVLDNDEQPEGKPITLLPDLAEDLPEGAGLLFVSGDRLRYLAPETAGNYVAVYSIESGGQRAEGRVTISVREENAATNSPPVPRRVTARVLAGETVRIQIPLSGVDPDGDSVQLIGITSNPEKGAVLSTGPTYIEFEAGEYSSGTDEFTYALVDSLGARAEGTVRVGISPRLDGARNPVANADVVSVRPDRTVSVQVLANDSDPDGSPLRVVSATPNSPDTTVEIVDDTVLDITPPDEPGEYSVIYTIQNEYGGTSQNFVTVRVDPEAPLSYPFAQDTVLTASDVVDRTTIDVDVLDNVFFADGDVGDLGVALLPGFTTTAELLSDKHIRVVIGDRGQIIPFSVSHPDDDSIRSFAFIWVPGYEDALPQLDRTAPLLTIPSEQTLTIDLDDYVITLRGQGVRLTDSSTVRATHSNGDDLVVDGNTLVFTSADQYFGPASITFEVTDGTSASDPDGRRAILTLPIDVEPRENQPPVFVGGVVDFEPGQMKELDLVRLTNYPYDDIDELEYAVIDPLPEGFSFELNGQRLVLRASNSVAKGTTTDITLTVRDDLNQGRAGRIRLQVVPSTLPLVKPVADTAITPRGSTTTIDVLANDEVNNPFPGQPLQVVDIRGLDGAALPDGVSIVPSADRSRLTVTVSATAAPVDTSLQYQVADATQDRDRYVWGSITISVQDVPDPVSNVTVTEFTDRQLRLAWAPGVFNNSPIERYEVTMTSAASGDFISTTSCTSSVNCAVTTPGNGPSNAVRLSVVAINALGPSQATALSGAIWSDVIPPMPTALDWTPLDQGLRVIWRKPAPEPGRDGSPIEQYVVTVGPLTQVLTVSAADPIGTLYTANLSSPAIANASAVGFSVSARNSAPNSLATWNQASGVGIPAGAPTLAGPTVSASASLTDGSTASASWAGVFGDNGKAIEKYYALVRTGGGEPSCTVSGVENGTPSVSPPGGSQTLGAGTTSTTFGGLSANQTYTIWVFAYNGQGCSPASPVQVTPRAVPGQVTSITAPIEENGVGGEFYDANLTAFGIASGSTDADTFMFKIGEGGSASGILPTNSYLTSSNRSHYGQPLTVYVKACRAYPEATLCSTAWSPAFALGTPVWNVKPNELEYDPDLLTGTWRWTSMPGPGYEAVHYRCSNGNNEDGWIPMADTGECEGGALGSSTLRVRVTANGGQTYIRSYSSFDHPPLG